MKKISFKKAIASIAALSVVACMAAIPANAVTAGYTDGGKLGIKITQKEIDISEAGTAVPIYVSFDAASQGISAFEFGVMVDNRCTYEIVTKSKDAASKGGEGLDVKMTVGESETKGFTWLTFADSDAYEDEMNVVLFMVTVPEDAKVGDKFDIKYDVKSGASPELLRNDTDMIEYAGDATDGWIKIVGEEESSAADSSEAESSAADSSEAESSAADSSEAESSAADSSEAESSAADSSAVDSDSTGDSSTADSNASSSSTDSTTSSNGGGNSSNTSSGSGSPKTGSSDVLPIAGAAAAVAVLGGVALVAKKKND